MKSLKFILSVTALSVCTLTAKTNAQTQFDYLGGLPISANVTGCFYMDLNTGNTGLGYNDVKLVHGDGEIYFDGIYADSAWMPGYSQFAYQQKKLWQDCDNSVNVFNKSKVYVIASTHKLPNGSHVLPFKYGSLYNFLVLRVASDSVFVRGWVFNIPDETYECYSLSSLSPLDLEERFKKPSGSFKEYNYLGQPVDESHAGITIRVYEDGISERTYRTAQ